MVGYDVVCRKSMIDDDDANLLCNYAMFLKNVKNKPDKAEEMYKKLLLSKPDHACGHGMYVAIFI